MKYYIHALLTLNDHLQHHSGPYRFYWVAYLKAQWLLLNHPYGLAVITNSSDHPHIIYR